MLRYLLISQIVILIFSHSALSKQLSAKIHPCVDEIKEAKVLGSAELGRCFESAFEAFLLDAIDKLSLELDKKIKESKIKESVDRISKLDVVSRVSRKAFNNVPEWTAIPKSNGAAFCALSRVDDDTRDGKCELYNDNGVWKYRTGGHSGDQVCTAICLH